MNDTHAEAERVHIDLLRKAGPDQRGRIASRLSNLNRWRSRQAIKRAHPEFTDVERNHFFLQLHYGGRIAGLVQEYLRRTRNDS